MRAVLGLGQTRQQQRGQDRNDRDDYQHVKPPTMRLAKRTRGVVLVFIVFGKFTGAWPSGRR